MIISISGCTDRKVDIQSDQDRAHIANVSIDNSSGSNYSTPTSKNICESCHMSGKSSVPQAMTAKPHVEGGTYCLTCHKSLHDKHPIDERVTCAKCHEGESPTKPTFTNGSIVCNKCHNYPDPLQPSYGNLITVHENRGVTCITCHTQKCTKCHEKMNTNERWEKRSNHFKIMLDMLKYNNDI